jgi:ATP-binding cassette subfamily B protein
VHRDEDDVLGRAFDRRLLARLWAASRAHRRIIIGSTLLFPVIAAVELAQPYLLKVAIDDHILKNDWTGLLHVAAAYLGTLVVLYGLRTVESYLMNLTGQRVMHDLRAGLFSHLLRLEAGFFDRNPVGRLMTRVMNDVEAVNDAFTSGLFAIVADVVTLAGVVAIMLWMDWRLALVTFAIMPALFVVAGFFRVRARDAYRLARQRLARLNAFLQESLSGMTVIQLFARERQERRAFEHLSGEYRRALFGSTVYEASLYAAVETLGSLALALLIWYGSGGIAAGTITFGALVAFIQYTSRFFLPIRDLGAKYTVMQSAMASSERIFGLLEREPAIVTPVAPYHAAPPAGTPGFEFHDVWFAYDDEDWVLRDCTFRVAPGEHVAIVGATGEGKTTCARLLNRSYDVRRGRVLVEGVDVREWDLERLRRRVGVVFQDTLLFTGTIEANVTAGVDGGVTRADVERAVQLANAGPFVASLPRGLDEPLGERAVNLSHGQRQLLAIARALVYNPAILVLDEATSSVDVESEQLVQDAMRRLLAGRTTLTIAHRLSTVQHADRILVLHRGRIHEEGTHTELVQRGGLYARLLERERDARV